MGIYIELTSLGDRVAEDVDSRRHLQGISAQAQILVEVKHNQPAEKERFLHKMENLGYSEEWIEEVLDDLEGLGLIKR